MTLARLADAPDEAVAAVIAGRASALAVRTSGSTGMPREVVLGRGAVLASAAATTDRLGGPGAWLLAVPPDRVAGAMVMARAMVADAPVTRMPTGTFTAEGFARAADAVAGPRAYVSLVPTQVRRLLQSPVGREALARFDAVLVGGAPPGMELPSNAVETYGMTETCGGCVYDGVPLAGVGVRIADNGRICLSGPMLADGYVDGDNSVFQEQDGSRWFMTSDLGAWDGRELQVWGRADDVIVTGGHKVHPAAVERALMALPSVADAVVTSLPDNEWGEVVAAVVVPTGVPVTVAEIRESAELERFALPRLVANVDTLPRTEAGKIDRSAARILAAQHREENA